MLIELAVWCSLPLRWWGIQRGFNAHYPFTLCRFEAIRDNATDPQIFLRRDWCVHTG
eukprot:m.46191 g.46191  ORF g.46191 m.46191 type:complete len:57 (-) comp10911_c0_seq4:5471-5641(-)